MEEKQAILYLCDKTQCKDCRPECNHTFDILHAKSFKKEYGHAYVEHKESTFWGRLMAASMGLTISVGVLALGFKFVMWLLY